MRRRFVAGAAPWLGLAVLAWMAGCHSMSWIKSNKPAAEPDLTPTAVDYVDSDAFDGVFESALVNQDAVILVNTGHESPDWGPRLNAWIAAWNAGGHSRPKQIARGQAPTALPKVVIDGDSIREFRLLVDSLIGRIEEVAQGGSAWYRDQRQRSRRVGLLKPYNLRFHKAEDSTVQLIFFHERNAKYYPGFVKKLTGGEEVADGEWARTVECSECKAVRRRRDRLTGRER
jgi:hypothetical protein